MTYQDFITTLPALRRSLMGYACRYYGPERAEDLVQEILADLLTRSAELRLDGVIAYGITALKHRAWRQADKARRMPIVPLSDETTNETADVAVAAVQDGVLEARQALALIAALPEERRQLVQDVVIDGMSYDEAARKFGVSVGTVKSRVSRSLAALRDGLDGRPLPRQWRMAA